MAQAKKGDKVRVHYTGKLVDGKVFDTSENQNPLEFTIGQGEVIPGFEEGVVGMNTGESKTVNIASDQAYGPHFDEMTTKVNRDQIPSHIQPKEGQQLQFTNKDGQKFTVTITEVNDTSVVLDANHPLAGKELVFDIKLVEIL